MLSNNSTNLWPLQGVFVLFSKKNRSFSSICALGDALEAHPAQGIAFAEHEVVLEQPVLIAHFCCKGVSSFEAVPSFSRMVPRVLAR